MEKKDIVPFNEMWALNDILTVDWDSLDENNKREIRADILKPFLNDSAGKILAEAGKGEVYRLVCKPEGIDLYINPDGTFSGAYRNKDGTIAGLTQWEKTGIDFAGLVKNLADVAINIYIANKVNEIEKIAEKILEGQFLDRKSIIDGVIESYDFLNEEQKKDMEIMNPKIQELLIGIAALKDQLICQELVELDAEDKNYLNILSHHKNESNNEKFNKINFMINYIIFAYRTLIMWEVKLNNKQEGTEKFNAFMNKMNELNMWDKIYNFAKGTTPLKRNKEGELYFRGEDYKRIKEIIDSKNEKKDFVNLIEYKQVEFNIKKQYLEEALE